MDLQSIGAYSPDIVYGQLTSPFVEKRITLNSHTPYDNVSDAENKAYSLKSFRPEQPKMRVSIGEDSKKYGLKYPPETKETTEDNTIKPEISYFEYSKIKNSKDIVSTSLKNGYSAQQSLVVAKAQKAYKNGVMQTDNVIRSLGQCTYAVVV